MIRADVSAARSADGGSRNLRVPLKVNNLEIQTALNQPMQCLELAALPTHLQSQLAKGSGQMDELGLNVTHAKLKAPGTREPDEAGAQQLAPAPELTRRR